MRKSLLLAAALTLPFGAVPAVADNHQEEEMKPERMEGVTWARVSMTKFKSGKRARALEIIRDYFAKADGMAGLESGVHGIHLNSGEWDVIYVFPMKGGPSDLTWITSPDDIKWMASMVELAGGQEEAMKILEEFDSLVQESTSYIGHAHSDH